MKMTDFGVKKYDSLSTAITPMEIARNDSEFNLALEQQRFKSEQEKPTMSFGEIYDTAKETQSIGNTVLKPIEILTKEYADNDKIVPNTFTPNQYAELFMGISLTVHKQKLVETAMDSGYQTALAMRDYFVQQEKGMAKFEGQNPWTVIGASILADLTDPYSLALGAGIGAATAGVGTVIGGGIKATTTGLRVARQLARQRTLMTTLGAAGAGFIEGTSVELLRKQYNPTITGTDVMLAGVMSAGLSGTVGGGTAALINRHKVTKIQSQIDEITDLSSQLDSVFTSGQVTDELINEKFLNIRMKFLDNDKYRKLFFENEGMDINQQMGILGLIHDELAIQKVELLNQLSGFNANVRLTNAEVWTQLKSDKELGIVTPEKYNMENVWKDNPSIANQAFRLEEWVEKFGDEFETLLAERNVRIAGDRIAADLDDTIANKRQRLNAFVRQYEQAINDDDILKFIKRGTGDFTPADIWYQNALNSFKDIKVPSKKEIDEIFPEGTYERVKANMGDEGLKMLKGYDTRLFDDVEQGLNVRNPIFDLKGKSVDDIVTRLNELRTVHANSKARFEKLNTYYKQGKYLGIKEPQGKVVTDAKMQTREFDFETGLKTEGEALNDFIGDTGEDLTPEQRIDTVNKAVDDDELFAENMYKIYNQDVNANNIKQVRSDFKEIVVNNLNDTCKV